MLDVGWGDLDRLLRRRSRDPRDRHLHGVDRRRAGVPVGGARGGADQADHRHQGRAQRSRQPRRHVAHGRAHRIRRGAGRRLPPRRRAARERDRGGVRPGRDAGQAAAPDRTPPDDRDQRRRPGRAGDGRAGRGRRRAGRAVRGFARAPGRRPARRLEPRQSDRRPGRRDARSLRAGARDRGGGSRERRAAGDPDAAGHDRSDADRGGADPLRARRGQAGARELDGRRTRRRRRRYPESRRHPDLRVSGRCRPRLLRHGAVRGQPARALRDAGAQDRRRRSSRRGRRDHRPRVRRGQDAARRGGGEGGARELRHPGRADARGPRQGCGDRGGARDGLPGRGQAVVARHHAQDRRRRRQARAGGRGRRRARVR